VILNDVHPLEGCTVRNIADRPQILDWYKKTTGQEYTAQTDPGVKSVQQIFK
jgi:hypothetical protein